ncbi:MAG: PQQ-binding-like beta-propeller repeat protein [PVC group bacterium]|nr:PQQ-binding-like beta-propeller repeat protein [PVC group bacterium]
MKRLITIGLILSIWCFSAILVYAGDGDFAIYREATGGEASTATAADVTWDTTVSADATFSISANTSVDLSEGGHYFVMYNIGWLGSGGNRRSEQQMWLNLAGSEIVWGRSTGYIRRSNAMEAWQFGAAIINANAGDDLKIVEQRTDTYPTMVTNRIANSSSLMVLKLNDNWDYARISEAGGGQAFSSTTATAVTWDTNDELDTGSFTHTGDTDQITLKTAGHYLVTANIEMLTSGTSRTAGSMYLSLDGTEIDGTRTTSYIRGTDGTNNNTAVFSGIIETSSADQVLRVMMYEKTGSNPTIVANKAGITIVKLPDTADYVRLVKTTTQAVDGTDDPITWDSQVELDTGSFGNSSNLVTFTQDSDYLFLATFWADGTTNNSRNYPHWEWRKSGTKIQYGSGGKYSRGTGSAEAGNSLGLIAHGITTSNNIDIVNTDETNKDDAERLFQANRMALQAINMKAFLPPVITDAADEVFYNTETSVTITGDRFRTTKGTGKLELCDSATYATANKIEQTTTAWGNTSIDFTVNRSTLAEGTLYLFITNDDGQITGGYSVEVYDLPAITNVSPSTFVDTDTGIDITGSNFNAAQGSGIVELGNAATYAGSTTKVSQTVTGWAEGSITFTAVQGALGGGDVYVYVTDDYGHVSSGYQVKLAANPLITDIDDEVFYDGETSVTIIGDAFYAAKGTGKVELADSATYATANKVEQTTTSWGNSSIDFTVNRSTLSEGSLYVFVTNDDALTSAGYAVYVYDLPSISGVDPTSFMDSDTGIDISGADFGASQGTGILEIGDAATYAACVTKVSQTVTSWADDTITFTAVQGALTPGTVYLYVTDDNGHVSAAQSATLTVPPPPSITLVDPAGFTNNDPGIEITGSYFDASQGTGKVELGDASTYGSCTILEEQTITSWASDTITFTAVRGALTPGGVYLYVTNDDSDTSTGTSVNIAAEPIPEGTKLGAYQAAGSASGTTSRSRYMAMTSPDIDNIRIIKFGHKSNVAGSMRMGLYVGGAIGNPDNATLAADSGQVTHDGGGSWQEFDLTTPYDLAKNTQYGVAWKTDGASYYFDNTSLGNLEDCDQYWENLTNEPANSTNAFQGTLNVASTYDYTYLHYIVYVRYPTLSSVSETYIDDGDLAIQVNGVGFEDDNEFGNSANKIYLGDAATYAACSTLVEQTFTAWADAQITFNVSKGDLSDGTVYVYVINDNSQVSDNGQSVILDVNTPTNPTAPASGWDVSGKTNALTNNTWGGHASAYFEWTGADDSGGSGVSGYSVYWGTDSGGEPGVTQDQAGSSYDAGAILFDGIYYLRVRTFDNIGKFSEPITLFTYKYDKTDPVNPTSPSGAWYTSSKIDSLIDDTWQNDDETPYFEWSGATDATSGVSGYSVYWGTAIDGEPGLIQEQVVTTLGEVSATGDNTYYLRIRTFDFAGNYSDIVNLFTCKFDNTVPANPTAPALAWDSSGKSTGLTDNTVQNIDDTPYFEWSGATDATSGVSGYSVYWGIAIDGEPEITQEQTAISYDISTPTGDATYYLRVRTFDNATNYSDAITVFTFIYDSQKPTVLIEVSPDPTGSIPSGSLEFKLTFSETMDIGTTPTITYDPSGATGVQSVSTGGSWSTTTYSNDTYTVYNDNAITSTTGDGVATISVTQAKDPADNTMDADTDDSFDIDSAMHHFRVEHDGSGLINVAELLTITAVTQGGNTAIDYTGTITVSTQGETAQISWDVNTGTNAINDGGAGNDSATYLFDAADNGVVVLEMISTAPDTLDIEVDDTTYTDDDTEGNIVISSYALDHFVISHDNSGEAGVGENVTVTAINTESQTKTDYVGTITLDTTGTSTAIGWSLSSGNGIFNDGGGASDTATYNFNINDNGVATFIFTGTKVETLDIDVADGAETDDESEGTMAISPSAIDHFDITHDNSAVAGGAENVTITAKDAYENIKTNFTGTVTLDTDGDVNAVSWAEDAGNQGTFNDGGSGVASATYTFALADNGTADFTITDTKTESIDIDVSGSGKYDSDEEGLLLVTPGSINYFIIVHDNSAAAGVAEGLTVTSYDQYDNIKTDYTGEITLDTDGTATSITWALDTGNGIFADGGGLLDTATYTYDAADSGVATFTITDTTQESLDIDISGDANDNDSEGNLIVGLPVISYFVVLHDGAANAGVTENVTVTAKDSLGATMTSYVGQIQLDTNGTATTIVWALDTGDGTFNDGGASVDTALYTYDAADNGVAVFSIIDNTQETINIAVTGDGKTDNNTEGNLIVGVPLLSHFTISHDGNADAGVDENVTVTAKDTVDSTKTDYTGQITLDTNGTSGTITWALDTGNGTFNDGGALVDTATYNYTGSDNGVAIFTINDTTAESLDIDVSSGGIVDDETEGNLIVATGALDYFLIEHDNAAVINISELVIVTPRDSQNNIITDYTGQITLDTNTSSPSGITWTLLSGNGSFVDGGGSVDTATYTYALADSGTASFSIKSSSLETINLAVSGDGENDDNTEGNLVVGNAAELTWGMVDAVQAYATTTTSGRMISGYSPNISNMIITKLASHHGSTGSTRIGCWTGGVSGDPTGATLLVQTGNETVSSTGWAEHDVTDTPWPKNTRTWSGYALSGAAISYANNGAYNEDYDESHGRTHQPAGLSTNPATAHQNITGDGAEAAFWYYMHVMYTIEPGVNAISNSVISSSVDVGSSDKIILDLSLTNDSVTADTITAVTINNVGTASDSDISSVKLYYDSNNSEDYSPGADTQVGSGVFSSGTKTFSNLSINIDANLGTEELFVVVDISNSATPGNTIDVAIPANGITLSGTGTIEDAALNSSGNRSIVMLLDHFTISHDTAGLAGSDESITIMAKDSYGNTKIDYTGTINIDTTGTAGSIAWALSSGSGVFNDDGASVDTCDYTFSGADNGVVVLSLNDTISETLNISVSGDTKTDDNTEGDLVISPAPIHHFVIGHDNTAEAGIGESITVTAKDEFENTLVDYSSQITLDTNGSLDSISWTLSSGFGSFADGGGSVDTATYTFDETDDGVATFTMTDTISETINISVSGDTKTDDNTEGDLVVSAGTIDYFVISHDEVANAGIAETITITAKDSLGNTKADYIGTITIDTNGTVNTITWSDPGGNNGVFTEGGASVDTATYEYAADDNGEVTLNITDTKTEGLDISVTGDTKTDDDTEGDLTINPGVIDYFIVSHDGTAVTGISEDLIVTAYDAEDNIKTDYTGTITLDTNGTSTAITWTLKNGSGTLDDDGSNYDTADYTFNSSDLGTATFGIIDFAAETINVDVTGDAKTDDDTEGNLQFISSGIDHFLIVHDGDAIAGIAENITIYAKDANEDTITTYQGQITINTDGSATGIGWALNTGSGSFVDGGGTVDTATYTFDPTDNGVVILELTDTVEETIDISIVGEGKNDDDTEGVLEVNPAGMHHFNIVHDGNAQAGIADSITIQVHDANHNTVTDYTGEITVYTNGTATAITWAKQTGSGSFSEGGPTVDTATYTFVFQDNGVCVLTLADTKVETLNIGVSGGGKLDDDTEGALVVGPGLIDQFVITHDGGAIAGISDNVTIRAEDAYANLKTDYTGMITVDTNGTVDTIVWAKVVGNGTFLDGGASVDTATYTFDATDSGQCTLSVSDTIAESLNVSVSGDAKVDDDTEGDLVVTATSLDHFVVSHDNTAEAAVAESITITAYDIYENVKENYTGQITVDTSGTANAITWGLSVGNGTFLDGGASVDTATYTYADSDDGVVILTISDTVAQSIDVDCSGDAKTDDDTEGNLVVGATVINYFKVNHDELASAGVAENVTITAYDTYDNAKTNYTGTITVDTDGSADAITWAKITGGGSFVDGGGAVDTATYTYVAGDLGVVVLSITANAAESLDIDITGSSKSDDDTDNALVVSASTLEDFLISHDGQGVVNSGEPITITARDAYQNTKLDYTGEISVSVSGETGEITWAVANGAGSFADGGQYTDTANYTFHSNDEGVVILTLTDDEADTVNIAVSGGGKADENSEGTLSFTSSYIVIDNLDSGYTENATDNDWTTQTAGNEYSSDWRRDTTFNDGDWARWTPDIDLNGNYEVFAYWSSNGAANATDAPYTIYYNGGNDTVDKNQEVAGNMWNTLGTYEFISGTSGYVQLDDSANDDLSADAIKFELRGSANASANSVTTDAVEAGESDILILDFTVTNNYTENDTVNSITMNNNGTVSDSDIISIKLFYDSNNSYDYSPGVDSQIGTGTFSSGTKTFSGLNITVPGAGTKDFFVVLAIDSDVAQDVTLDVQIPIDGITLANAPEVEDSIINSSGTRTVSLVLDYFVIAHDNAANAGTSEDITVTAKDQYGNTVTSYEGTITLDTNGTVNTITWALDTGNGSFDDGGALADTATYTFNNSDNGIAVFTINDTKTETINIAVSGSGKSDENNEGDLVVSAGTLAHFDVDIDNSAIVGLADLVTVTAHDVNHNIIENYTGTITLDTNGTEDTITWGLNSGFGNFTDNGVLVDTATYEFDSSDNSTVVFLITDTMAETINIAVSGDGQQDYDDEGNLVFQTGSIDHFLIAHDGSAQAGVVDNITITAKDAYENTLVNYTGQITVDTDGTAATIEWAKVTGNGTFNDGGLSVDTATYTYNSSDNGVVVLSIKDTTLESLNIAVSGDGKSDDDTEGLISIGTGVIDHFAISHDGFAMQNQTEDITIKAYDAYNNIKTDYTGEITVDTDGSGDITWALDTGGGVFNDGGGGDDTATYTYVGGDSGEVVLSITDLSAEIINISVSGDTKTDDDNEGVLEVVAAGFHHFKITHDGNAVTGVAEQITITAKDVSDDTVTNYAGTMTVDTNGTATAIAWGLDTGNGTFNDDGAGVDTADYTFNASDNGVVILTLTDTNQETINISASGSGKTDDNTEGSLVINLAGIDHFIISHDGAAFAGMADDVNITAKDANSATVTSYTGTITIDTSGTSGTITWALVTGDGSFNDGGAAVDTADYTFVSGDNGVVTLSINDTTAETLNISVSGDGKTDDNTEGNMIISHSVIDYFAVLHDGEAEAGVAEEITIEAKDEYGNTLVDYTSQITVDTNGTPGTITWGKTTGDGVFNNGGAGVDTATYTFAASDDGVVVLNITDTTVETLNISVSGDSKTDNDTEGDLNVGSGALEEFIISHDGTAVAGTQEAITVTAYDTYSNIKTNYTGQITLDTNGTQAAISWALSSGVGTFNDGGASVDTATYTFVSADNGTATFMITDTKAETIDVNVSGSGKFDDDSEGTLVVSPAVLNDFKISHDAQAIAGTSENITIYAKDSYGNTKTDYTGQIIVDTNGTETTITWALVTGNGTFNDDGASVDTADYTFDANDNGEVILSINDTTAEVINISVSGNSKFDDDTEGNLTVNSAVIDCFVIVHDGSAVQSVGELITVTAKDQYANSKADYTGTITLDTNGDANNIAWALNTGSGVFNDGGASVDTATYAYVSGDSGVALFEITDNTAQTINISVSGDGQTDDDTEGNLVVQASSTTVSGSANTLTSYYVPSAVSGKLVLDVTLTNNDVLSTDTLESITINNVGTIMDSQVNLVKLYYDSNNSSSYTPGVDNEIGSGTFSGGSITFNNVNVQLSEAGTEEIFVTIDLKAGVSNGVTVDASIPVDGMNFANAPDSESIILNSSGNLTVDSATPGEVTNLATSSHNNATSAWDDPQSRDDTVYVSWTPALDSGSGIDGYSILWDTSPTTLPDTTQEIEESITAQTSAELAVGNAHYFHIRSIDKVGNWDDQAAHIGPFYIDTTSPVSTSIYQITEYAGGDYLYVSGNTVYYSGVGYSAFRVFVEAADGISALKEAVFPTTTSAGGTDATEESGAYEYIYTYEVTAAGNSYNDVNVAVSDVAGNTTNVSFSVVLDETSPATVASLSSSTHTPSVTSADNDVTLNWTDASDAAAGLAGYSIVIDTASDTLPPQYKNVNNGVETYIESDLDNGTYYAHIRPVDNVGNWTASATHAGPYIVGRGSLDASIAASQAVVSTDQQFMVTMTVDNTGDASISDVDISSLTVTGTSGASATTGSNPASQDISSSDQKQFQWTYTAGSSSGTINFKGSAQGTDQEGSIISDIVISSDIVVEEKAALSVAASASPSTANTNETITITVTVTNSGAADALTVAPSLTPSGTASPAIDSGPSPANATVGGGKSKDFTFTAHGTAAGTATFTANLTSGTDENSGDNLSVTDDADSVTVETPIPFELTSLVSATPVAVNTSETITVTMSVQNTGANSIANVTPSSLVVGGTSSDAVYATGPVPANVASLASGASQNFTWTYTAGTTLGTVNFSGNAVGTEASSTSNSSSDITIQAAPATLTSTISSSPTSLLTNASITVTMTVTNTASAGGAASDGTGPSNLSLDGTSGEANLLTGPIPVSADIAAGASQDFVWTYRAGTTAGTVNFSGNASGTDGNSGADVSSTSNSSNNVTISTLSPDWMYPTGTDVTGPVRGVPIAYWGMRNYIYFGSDDNNLYVLDGDTHELVFAFTSSGMIRGLPYPSSETKGAGTEDVVYFGTLGKTIYSLWADNSLNWERVMGEELSTTILYDYVSGVYFGTKSNRIYCLDSTDGTDGWAAPADVGGSVESDPAMIYVPTLDYDEVYFGASDGKIYAFKAADGTGARSFDTGFGETGAIKTAPFISNQEPGNSSSRRLVFFGTANGRFYAVNTANLSASTAETGWDTNPVVVGDAVYSSPWVDADTDCVYFGSQDGKIYALNLADGTSKANFPVDIGSPIDSAPLVENGVIYCGADNGKFYAVDIATGTLVPGWPYDTGDAIKGGAALHLIYDTETWDVIDTYVLVGSDSGKIYSFQAVQ